MCADNQPDAISDGQVSDLQFLARLCDFVINNRNSSKNSCRLLSTVIRLEHANAAARRFLINKNATRPAALNTLSSPVLHHFDLLEWFASQNDVMFLFRDEKVMGLVQTLMAPLKKNSSSGSRENLHRPARAMLEGNVNAEQSGESLLTWVSSNDKGYCEQPQTQTHLVDLTCQITLSNWSCNWLFSQDESLDMA